MRRSRSFPACSAQPSRIVVLPTRAVAEHQISIWCSQAPSLLCSVNDAVNVLPCSTCAYLNGWLSQPALPYRTTLAFQPPPDYGSGGLAMVVLADAAPCVPFPAGHASGSGRFGCRLSSRPLPQCPRAHAAVAGVHSAGCLRVAGVRRPRLRSHSWTPMSAGCADLARNQGRPWNRTPRQCPPCVRDCGQVLVGRPLSVADTAAAP
jgi:hypothetical protein